MTFEPGAYLKSLYPLALLEIQEKPRLFRLHWDMSKVKVNDVSSPEQHEAFGTLYPNGRVTLDFGAPYESYSALMEWVTTIGECRVEWMNGENEKSEEGA